MRSVATSRAVAAILWAVVLVVPAAAEPLRVGGTGAAMGLMRQLATGFAAVSETPLQFIPSMGSSGAIRAAAEGVIDLAVSSRPLKPEERAQGLTELAFARTPFVLATSHSAPNGLKSADIAAIFKADKPSWADGTPVKIILRPRSESDTALMGELFPGMAAVLEAVRKRGDLPIAATDQDNADLAERMSGSLTGAALAQLMTERRNLRTVALDGVEPSVANFENGRYRFGKTFYLITRARPNPEVERFLSFLQSPPAKRLLREAGTMPDGP
jgi:phosphate transport system substrate-binding protein